MSRNQSTRELFRKIIYFEPAPRTLKWEFAYWSGVIDRWYREGLPKVNDISYKLPPGGVIEGQASPYYNYNGKTLLAIKEYDISSYFNFDSGMAMMPYSYFYHPAFEEKVIYEDKKYIEKINSKGIRTRELKDGSSMPMWLEFPVKTKADWEEIKKDRLSLDSIKDRYMLDINTIVALAKARDYPLGVLGGGPSFFGSLRFLMGEEKLFMAYYDYPELIKDMVEHLCNLWLAIVEELTSKIEFDIAYFWEDMSGKNGALISPATFRQFMTPYYRKITDLLKSKGIDKCVVDTDGRVDELIPLFLESGVNMMYPFERQAENDLIEYRKKYPNLVMMGGFDKNTLYKGKDAIDKELDKMRWLISQGGYIPYCDHAIPPNSSWDNFKYYREKLNHIIDSTEVRGTNYRIK